MIKLIPHAFISVSLSISMYDKFGIVPDSIILHNIWSYEIIKHYDFRDTGRGPDTAIKVVQFSMKEFRII